MSIFFPVLIFTVEYFIKKVPNNYQEYSATLLKKIVT